MPKDLKHILNIIETWIIKNLENTKSGVVIADRRRVFKQGQSEWVYTNLKAVTDSFTEAQANFIPQYPDLHFIVDHGDVEKAKKLVDKSYKSRMKMPEKFISEYIFNINKADNVK